MPDDPRIAATVARALDAVAASPSTAMQPSDVRSAAAAVTTALAPALEHVANAEPWYRSRVTWGAIISTAIPILGALGVSTDWIDQGQAVAVGVAIGTFLANALTLYGRWKARKPIGR